MFGESPRAAPPAREAVDSMDFTLAVLKEALRLYSVVPVVTRVAVVRALSRGDFRTTRLLSRICCAQADDVLGSSFIPRGTKIILSLQGVHQRADLCASLIPLFPPYRR